MNDTTREYLQRQAPDVKDNIARHQSPRRRAKVLRHWWSTILRELEAIRDRAVITNDEYEYLVRGLRERAGAALEHVIEGKRP